MLKEIICKRLGNKKEFSFDIISSDKLNANELNHLIPVINKTINLVDSFCSYSQIERKRIIKKMNKEGK